MLCAKFGWNWSSGFLKFFNVFLLFPNYLPLEKDGPLHSNKLEFPLPKNALCQVFLKLAKWFLRRSIFFILSMYLHYFVIISPWKRAGPSFEQNWIPFTQGCFLPSLVEIGSVVLEEKMKCERIMDRQTRKDRWSEKLTWAFSSSELKTY